MRPWMRSSYAGRPAIGAALAETDETDRDEFGVELGEVLGPQAEPGHRLRAHRIHEHVGAGEEVAHRLHVPLDLEVEHDTALVPVELQECAAHLGVLHRRNTPCRVTSR